MTAEPLRLPGGPGAERPARTPHWVMYQAGHHNPPGPMVFVCCRNRVHEPRVSKVACFYRPPGEDWQQMPVLSARRGLAITWQMLQGDQLIPADDPRLANRMRHRRRYVLQCRTCGQSTPIRHGNLCLVLDRLAGYADAWVIDLASIRTMIASSKTEMARNTPSLDLPAEAIRAMSAERVRHVMDK